MSAKSTKIDWFWMWKAFEVGLIVGMVVGVFSN